jgi:Ca2+:H+ antiporter
MRRLFAAENLLNWLLLFVPVAAVLEWTHANPTLIFAASAMAIIPLAGLMGKATEHLAERLGEGIGGFLNGTFGNAAELIIAIMALQRGLHDVVKASITGSIIGNVLLVFGLSVLAGGLRFSFQRFNATAAGVSATMLGLSAVALVVPAIFHALVGETAMTSERGLSFDISVVLMVTYALSLVFTLRTHKHLYVGGAAEHGEEALGTRGWSWGRSIGTLVGATALVALMSEFLVGAVEHTASQFAMTEVFVGVILVAIIGNAAEHSTAVLMALRNKMDLAINIAVGSSIQIALFVAPFLVFLSYAVGPAPMDLLFTTFEVLAVAICVGVLALIAQDGESNWLEGVQMLAVYAILGMAFYFLPAASPGAAH